MSAPVEKPKAGDARPCKACGMPIEFRVGPEGRLIPMQRVRSVYALKVYSRDGVEQIFKVDLGLDQADGYAAAYVSHFETCPRASEFSKKAAK